MLWLFELVGDDRALFSSDFPHGEGRENSALEILQRPDLSETQRRKLLYDNTVGLFGEPWVAEKNIVVAQEVNIALSKVLDRYSLPIEGTGS